MRIRLVPVLAVLTALIALGACSGSGGGDGGGSTADLQKRLSAAKKAIDDATSLEVSIVADEVPDGVSGLKSATGVGTHAPAFKGKVSVVSGGSSLSADVVATDGKVWAKLGFAPSYLTISPETLHAPDPATLVGRTGEDGLAVILEDTKGLEQGKRSRDGKAVLTTIKGTIDGDVIRTFLPTAAASGTFRVSYRLDDDDVLRDASITGPFYGAGKDATYRVELTPSSKTVTIDPPEAAGGA